MRTIVVGFFPLHFKLSIYIEERQYQKKTFFMDDQSHDGLEQLERAV